MALTVLFVSGPRRGGKSTAIQHIIHGCDIRSPHYLRLTQASGDKCQPASSRPPRDDCGVASAQWIHYDEDHAFECVPEVLGKIYGQDRHGLVIIEADADPILRNAYPYDFRLFVMPAPRRFNEVFRSGEEAKKAFHATLNDTAAFAREIYGLAEDGDRFDDHASEQRTELTGKQLLGLMNSPLGDELATRILLQPSHHGLLESDILLVNTAVGGTTDVVDRCVQRLENVLTRVRTPTGRTQVLFSCDPADRDDPLRTQLFSRLSDLLDCEQHESQP